MGRYKEDEELVSSFHLPNIVKSSTKMSWEKIDKNFGIFLIKSPEIDSTFDNFQFFFTFFDSTFDSDIRDLRSFLGLIQDLYGRWEDDSTKSRAPRVKLSARVDWLVPNMIFRNFFTTSGPPDPLRSNLSASPPGFGSSSSVEWILECTKSRTIFRIILSNLFEN